MTRIDDLASRPHDEQRRLGYADTLREILQQPSTWLETEALVAEAAEGDAFLAHGPVLLTGSGSSHYVGEALAPSLARALGSSVRAVPAGSLLTEMDAYVAGSDEGTLVSFARSGDSPESAAVVDRFLSARPRFRHLVVTCNRHGALATRYRDRDDVRTLVLAGRTCDRSLVMTSSFTNLWLAGRLLLGSAFEVDVDVDGLAEDARVVLGRCGDLLHDVATRGFPAAIFLGTGALYGSARECALKVLEMSDGRKPAFAETFLGLRHGPLAAAREGALVVALLSSEEPARSYERDLLGELEGKKLDVTFLTVGPSGDVPLRVGDDDRPPLGVLVGQLLGLFTCLRLGLRPDAPSPTETISRVVTPFRIR